MTHSTVALPVAAFAKRIDKLARECGARVVRALPAGSTPEDTVAAVATFLQRECGFRVPDTGRSALPKDAILDHRALHAVLATEARATAAHLYVHRRQVLHISRKKNQSRARLIPSVRAPHIVPKACKRHLTARAAGVWEDARQAYLHEVLVRKHGSAAALCVLFHGVLQRLFLAGDIDFAARIDCRCALDSLCWYTMWGGAEGAVHAAAHFVSCDKRKRPRWRTMRD